MIFDYLFLNLHFNSFAFQAEWVRANASKCESREGRGLYFQYVDCRESMAQKMLSFKRETSSLIGWLKSFVPNTTAFNARKILGSQLQISQQLFIKFSMNYYDEKQKAKVNIYKEFIRNQQMKQENKQKKTFKVANNHHQINSSLENSLSANLCRRK